MEIKIQLENENKRPFENWTETSIKITKIKKWWIIRIKIQLENVNENKRPFKNCTKKVHRLTKIEKWWI